MLLNRLSLKKKKKKTKKKRKHDFNVLLAKRVCGLFLHRKPLPELRTASGSRDLLNPRGMGGRGGGLHPPAPSQQRGPARRAAAPNWAGAGRGERAAAPRTAPLRAPPAKRLSRVTVCVAVIVMGSGGG